MVSDPFGVARARVQHARGHGDKGNTIEGTCWQGDTGTRGRDREAEIQGCEDPGRQNAEPKIQGGVGQDRREFKSVNYNYLNQL